MFLGDTSDPSSYDTKVDYVVRLDEDDTIKLDYSKGAYTIPEPEASDNESGESTFVVLILAD